MHSIIEQIQWVMLSLFEKLLAECHGGCIIENFLFVLEMCLLSNTTAFLKKKRNLL
jgi:hypothetical protein